MRGEFAQRVALGVGAEDRLDHLARQPVARNREPIGALLVGPQPARDFLGERRETARNDRDIAAARAHGAHQRACARGQRDPGREHLVDHAERQVGEQRDPFAQRRFEGDLAAHRAIGDFGDVIADTDRGGELVDAFLFDQGRIHVSDQQPLGAGRDRLNDDVGALGLRDRFERRARLALVLELEKEVRRSARVEPPARREPGQGLRRARDEGIAERGSRRIDDERGDVRARRQVSGRRGHGHSGCA